MTIVGNRVGSGSDQVTHTRENTAIDSLHRAHRGPLLRFFSSRISDGAVAEDMVQQVFERLIQRGELDSIENAKGYIFRVAQSVVTDHLRKSGSRQSHAHEEFDESVHGGVDFSPEHVLAKRERLARAMQILQALPERTRVIFVLRRLEGVKYQEIATRLGISVSAVEKHMERAVAQLAKGMDDRI